MLTLLVPLLLQGASAQRRVLEAEDARAMDASVIVSAMSSSDTSVQRVAVRAAGRLERASLRDAMIPLLRSPSAGVRMEAVNALAQMNVAYAYASLIAGEQNGDVRAVTYESLGRVTPPAAESERALVAGLTDAHARARTGAVRGLESLFRKTRTLRPSDPTLRAIRSAFAANAAAEFRELALLMLNAARDRDSVTLALAWRDTSAQVRRLAVLAAPRWMDDPSPMVRYEVMRLAGTCERATAGINDPSELVALAAVDALGTKACSATIITPVVASTRSWRMRAHALVSLARVAPDSARVRVPRFVHDPVWQMRVYAATAAKLAKASTELAELARDTNPNVAIEAMTTVDDAVRALSSNHAGLLIAAAQKMRGAPELPTLLPRVLSTLERITKDGRATMRDPRKQLLERVRDAGDSSAARRLTPLLSDIDPAIASLAAEVIAKITGKPVAPVTTRYTGLPVPPDAAMRGLRGATARIVMKGLGTIELDLLFDDAPLTVATFAKLSEQHAFDGLTFHRMVPNFVIQGGSPGADEYDGATREFLRDELGLVRNMRGTFGVSTRGRDTGDGQIYINLVDNFRLDHDYTVFARITRGLDVMDRVLEGDVIESITVRRRN